MEKAPVFRQSVCNEPIPHQVHEVHIESTIKDKKEALLKMFPDFVEGDHSWASSFQVGGDPNAEDRDVDQTNEDKKYPSKQPGFALAGHDQGNSVGNDLRKELGLNRP